MGKKMSHWSRLTYAFAATTVISGVFIVLSAIIAPDVMAAYISDPYWVGVFVVSYLIAPKLARYVPEK